ncbi:unnamed protein product [Vitrella brassicaformis CCMP3155]|uniref:ZP domain-containing protein n=2 Tax=Vitrella brassicaformis TaxID=1169539 RepID=A0A0G4FWT2_VITBC|nr:unnamed protein product [Vitrella brassicaformis CCMP3155]|eukprot:CEM19602.1 unnamed protein product [Vitrella brassicaformis CCMP3155]
MVTVTTTFLHFIFFACISTTPAPAADTSSIAQPRDPINPSSLPAFLAPATPSVNQSHEQSSNTSTSISSTEATAIDLSTPSTTMPRRALRRAELVEKLLQGHGRPKAPPTLAWCSSSRMTAAIPVDRDPAGEGWPRGGFRNHTREEKCRAIFAEEFFGDKNETMRDTGRHALMASVAYGDCGMRESVIGKFVYYSNVMRVPKAESNAVVICACTRNETSAEGTEEGEGGNQTNATRPRPGECVATAKWEHTSGPKVAYKSKEVLTGESTAPGSGHPLSAEMVGGPNLTVSVNYKDDGFLFESWVAGSLGHPWPMLCDLVCPEGPSEANPGCVHHLIVNGCPADHLNDATSTDTTPLFRIISQSRGHIVFSLTPTSFPKSKEKDVGYRVQCMMAIFPKQPSLAEQCKYAQWRRRRLQSSDSQSHDDGGRGEWGDGGQGEGGKPAVAPEMVGEVEGQQVLNPLFIETFPSASTSPASAFVEIANEIIWDNWSINWGRDFFKRENDQATTSVQVGNDVAFVGVGIDPAGRQQLVNVGYGKTTVSVSSDELDVEAGVGIMVGSYGVRVDADADDRQYAVEAVARGTEVGANVDILDRDYGVRVKVRNNEVTVRHDFFDVQDPITDDEQELATEVFVGHRSTGVAVGSDVDDTEYGVSVGTLGYQFSVLRDFDERQTDFQGNWGDGYQLKLNGDFPDPLDLKAWVQVGFGLLGTAYVEVGAGVGSDGIPVGSAEVETDDLAIAVDFIDDVGERFFLFGLTVGKFTYTWESKFLPDNLEIPLILGAAP